MNALPLHENYINFKLARSLNDCAYYSRLIGRLEEAEEAIIECITLKEGGATLPRSLAVSLSEYAQILTARGELRQALLYSDRALQLIEQLLQQGNTSASSDKGMLLVERGHIYLQQARCEEARHLFEEAIPLLTSDTRKAYREEAEKQCEQLRSRLEISHHYQLDAEWYKQYSALASYDDLRWLAQAGPFEDEEQRVWDRLFGRRDEEEIWQQLATIIAQSKAREFSRSLAEQRIPRILYPALDIHDITSRIAGFEKLDAQIEGEEKNAVVRRLYHGAITEHLYTLHLVEATYHQDTEGVQKYNELLYGKPTTAEMAIALSELFGMFRRAQDHAEAGVFCQQLLKQLNRWNIHPEDFLSNGTQKANSQAQPGTRELPRKMFSAAAVQRFFEEIVHADYQFIEWQIIPAAERDNMALDLGFQRLYVPTSSQYSLRKILELTAEEIETHLYRSAVGRKSSLALLGSGTRGYLVADEGLAIHYTQQMMQAQGLGRKSYSWITTLAPGMVAGVLFPAMDFHTLYEFLQKESRK